MIVQQSNMERTAYRSEEMRRSGFGFPLCRARQEETRTCYLGLRHPPVGGPLKFLFVMHDMVKDSLAVKWEYLSAEGWKEMHPADGTEGFSHTGLISWYGRRDSARKRMFEQDLYWIRFREENGKQNDSDQESRSFRMLISPA